MKIYLAGPLFTTAERSWNSLLANNLRAAGHEVLVPQEFCEGVEDTAEMARLCLNAVFESDLVVANCDGTDVDSGTAMEVGYAHALEIPIVAYRTDFRRAGDCSKNVNLMIGEMANAFVNKPLGGYSEVGRAILGFIHRLGETQ